MVRGVPLTRSERRQLVDAFVTLEFSPEQCFSTYFQSDKTKISLLSLRKIRLWLLRNPASIHEEYIESEGKKRCGRKRKCTEECRPVLEVLAQVQPKLSYHTVAAGLSDNMGGNFPLICRQAIGREVKKMGISEKKITRRSKNIDENARADTLFILGQIPPSLLENMDQTSTASWKFLMDRGRSLIGQACLAYDWDLIGEYFDTCSAIGSYTERGWSMWQISATNIDGPFVKSFIENHLSRVVTPLSFLMHDGASVNACPDTASGIQNIFPGRNHQVASYSHDLSPVERGFANVWRYVREHFNRQTQTARDILNEAFAVYSCGSPGAAEAGMITLYFVVLVVDYR